MKTLFTLIALLTLLTFNLQAQWTQIGPPGITVYSLAVSGSNVLVGTLDSGVFRSSNNGQNWTQTELSDLTILSLAASGSNVFAGTFGGLFLSSNNGLNWALHGLSGLTILSLAVNGSNVFAGAESYPNGYGVYRSTNNGENWTQTSLNNQFVYSLAVNGSNVFAGIDGIYQSSNNGGSWTYTDLGWPIYSLAVSGSNIFAGAGDCGEYCWGTVFLSTNNGQSWTQTSLNSYDIVYSLAVSGSNVFAGTYYGVYLSTNNGQTWVPWNEGGMGTDNALAVNLTYVFAGTEGASVWRRPLSELTSVNNISGSIPKSYNLYQNYPNPFNPATTIKYALPKASFVTLQIYDILGREITTLVNEQLNPGTYETKWNALNYPSGIYFYKLTTENYSETKRMVLIK